MERKLPEDVLTILARLRDYGREAYLVGGCVRDLLRGETPHDWDICTSALPEETVDCFSDCTVHKTGIRHGTVLVMLHGRGYEVTTYRTEAGYADHRHPDGVRFVRSLREDLARRDFTVNAMAYAPEEGVIDLFGGQEDLSRGILRCVGVPEERFREDGLRMLRALRFSARLGFAIEPETARAILRERSGLDFIARERIFAELKGILTGRYVLPILRDYREVFAQFLPELRPMFDHPQYNRHHCYDIWMHTAYTVEAIAPEPTLRLCMLFHDCGKPDCFTLDGHGVGHFHGHPKRSAELAGQMLNRLRCDTQTKQDVLTLIEWHDALRVFNRQTVRRMLTALGERRARLLMQVIRADTLGKAPESIPADLEALAEGERILEALLAEGLCLSRKDLAVNGGDLVALGCSGPEIGRILDLLLSEVQEEKVKNERAPLLERAGEWMGN